MTYVGFPNTIRTDQESAATPHKFQTFASLHGINIEFTGVGSHKSMGKIEIAHGPLRRIYCMLSDMYPTLSDNLRLKFAVKSLNDTAGTNDLVSSLLVFGTIPSLGNTETELHDQEEKFIASSAARKEASTIITEKKIRLALRTNIPPSAKYSLCPGQLVMVYSEKKKQWIKDLRIVQLSSKQVWINYNNRIIKVSCTQVIPQPLPDEDTGISNLLRRLAPLNSKSHPSILVTEVLPSNDPRGNSPDFDHAKAQEITGLLDKKAFRVVLKEDLNRDANVLGGRFVLTIKSKGTDNEIFKARFVVQGHLDR